MVWSCSRLTFGGVAEGFVCPGCRGSVLVWNAALANATHLISLLLTYDIFGALSRGLKTHELSILDARIRGHVNMRGHDELHAAFYMTMALSQIRRLPQMRHVFPSRIHRV